MVQGTVNPRCPELKVCGTDNKRQKESHAKRMSVAVEVKTNALAVIVLDFADARCCLLQTVHSNATQQRETLFSGNYASVCVLNHLREQCAQAAGAGLRAERTPVR
jgi:hypothetical protein